MNILFLSHRTPFPPNKGDKIRSFHLIEYLAHRHKIYLVTHLQDETEAVGIERMQNLCAEVHAIRVNQKLGFLRGIRRVKPFTVAFFYHPVIQERVDDILENKQIDAIICFCSGMAEYILQSLWYRHGRMKNILTIMDFVDLDSDKWRQYAQYTHSPIKLIYLLENKLLFNYEKKINAIFDHSIFVSDREIRRFVQLYPQARSVKVIPNGVDCNYFTPDYGQNSKKGASVKRIFFNEFKKIHKPTYPILVFTGVMDYFANEDGVIWFSRQIFPLIKKEIPEIQFYVVGSKPTDRIWSLSEIDGITVTGYVEDIRPFYWFADICVVPLRIARGLQNKVLEAMAAGKAVVATSNAADGILCNSGIDLEIADGEHNFARAVTALIHDENRSKEMGKNAINNVCLNYSWDRNLKLFDEILQEVPE